MSHSGAKLEVEIKLPLQDARQGRRLLRAAGFRVARRRVHEINLVFDTTEGSLRTAGLLLRLRVSGTRCLLTFKGPATQSKLKSRTEIEVAVADPASLQAILEELGFRPVFRYEKFRTEYRQEGGKGLVTLDETPIGVFFELEGPASWIRATAKLLCFDDVSYVSDSYGTLYRAYCAQRGLSPGDMVFPSH